MPTVRPRHTLTETEDLAAALDDAALVWPDLRGDRGALLRKLIEVGRASVNGDRSARTIIGDSAGAATGAYPRDARRALLDEWPE